MKKKRRHITLIEIIVVMCLISLITGAVGYNVYNSLESGKAFTTVERMRQIKHIFALENAKGRNIPLQGTGNWQEIIKQYPLSQNPKKLLTDAWNIPFEPKLEQHAVVGVSSERLTQYMSKHNSPFDLEDPFDQNAEVR